MVSTLTIIVAIYVAGVTATQGVFAIIYAYMLFRPTPRRTEAYHPKAAVILAARGSDPFLVENMSTILKQDYPDFTFFVVLDSEEDSAWSDVRLVQSMAPERVVAMMIDKPYRTCSLKCSALSYVLERLDPSYEVVAFIDGDAKPHKSWLRELIEPLADPIVGVSTGNRWYVPAKISLGSMVRYFWNAGAIVQVWFNGLVWGGSMAVRREVIERTGLIPALRRSFVDDGAIVQQTKIAGLRAQFVPTVIVPNREDITIASFAPWSARQLVAARSSGAGWGMVLFHAFSIGLCVFFPVVMILAGSILDNSFLTYVGGMLMLAYWCVVIAATTAIELGMQSVFKRNGVTAKWFGMRAIIYYIPSAILSHLVYFWALLDASFCTRLSWRGIEYNISKSDAVEMIEYRPYTEGRRESQSLV